MIFDSNNLETKSKANKASIFSLANGHFGIRGSNPIEDSSGGTLINGYYESHSLFYEEPAYGYAKKAETIVTLPDLREIQAKGENGFFHLKKEVNRKLNLNTGELIATYLLSDNNNEQIELTVKEVISQTKSNYLAIIYSFNSLNYTGSMLLVKKIQLKHDNDKEFDPRVARNPTSIEIEHRTISDNNIYSFATKNSKLWIYIGTTNKEVNKIKIKPNATCNVEYDYFISNIHHQKINEPQFTTWNYQKVLTDSTNYWHDFWTNCNVNIIGSSELNMGIKYNIFQLTSSAGRDGLTNIASKGLSGAGYEGHYFWDTEMYMLPFFTLTQPKIAKKLLDYRYHIMPQAKKRAEQLGINHGCLFAWRSINGEETSAYSPASTAQYHINADIAYATWKYVCATNDLEFLQKEGFEILLETARFWKELGSWFTKQDKKFFGFFTVTGPDEYSALEDNNYYTNRMAKFNLEVVPKAMNLLKKYKLKPTVNTTNDELKDFADIANSIYLPYSSKFKINEQSENYFEKPCWPFDKTPKENYPLLLHYHPLTIYRYQVDKQADTLFADYLFDDINLPQLTREYAYYEKITTHDSSLSRSIFSILASELNDKDKAYNYFMDTALLDLTDLQGNTKDGLHLANLGGSWMSVVFGFAGLRYDEQGLSIKNNLPTSWNELSFIINYRGRRLFITLTRNSTQVKLISGDPISILVNGTATYIA